jgi:PIN domain nuclease of toxin-antitoxin system
VSHRLLLDTHVFLWWRGDVQRIRGAAREAIARAELVFISAATAWEAGIKAALGRLTLPDTVAAGVRASGFEPLPITLVHAELAAALPRHHADPFDRVLVAQAQLEALTLVTHDRKLESYDLPILWA